MDVDKALRDLYEEKKRLDRAIARLEAKLEGLSAKPRARRGRKTMGEEERREVSRRMAAYWAARRAARDKAAREKNEDTEVGNGVSA